MFIFFIPFSLFPHVLLILLAPKLQSYFTRIEGMVGRQFLIVLWRTCCSVSKDRLPLWIPSTYPWGTCLFFGDFYPSTERIWPFFAHEIMTRLPNMCCLIIAFTDLCHKLWLNTRRKVIKIKQRNDLFMEIN